MVTPNGETNTATDVRAAAWLPPGMGWAFGFNAVNTLSWMVIQGVPMQLFLKTLTDSALILGIAVGLTPLMQILQIPAASRLESIGYRRFVVFGWGWRNAFVLAIMLVALAAMWLPPAATVALTLAALVGYTALRGLSVAAFLPWFTRLLPEHGRGRYIAWEETAIQAASVVALLGCSEVLRWNTAHTVTLPWIGDLTWHGAWRFPLLFLLSFIFGMLALQCLRRIPDAPPPERVHNATPIPWRTLLNYRPFRRHLEFQVLLFFGLTGAGVYWVPLLKDRLGWSDHAISLVPILMCVVMVTVLPVLGRVVDATGSKPALAVAVSVQVVHLLLWSATGAGVLPMGPDHPWVAASLFALQASAGFGWALMWISSTRLLMSVVPPQGQAHFFAINGVATGLAMGLFPMLWGALHDLLKPWSGAAWGPWQWNAPSLLYALGAGIALLALSRVRHLEEPRAGTVSDFARALLAQPSRVLARWFPRGD
jgi:MFS family permease